MRDIFKTERLVLRPFVETDWKAPVSYAGDIDVARATGRLPHPYSYADAANWIAITEAAHSDHIYGIADSDDHLMGCISLMVTNDGWDIGYWLGKKFWHMGYMREATQALLTETRQYLAPTTICATVFKDNQRSQALLSFFGFNIVSGLSEFCLARGRNVSSLRLQLKLIEAVENA